MTRQIAFTSWGKGELSPQVRGRIDIQHYYSSAEQLKNMIVRPYGNLVRCAGTFYCGQVKDSSVDVRLIEFIFNSTASYILEMGPCYFRIWDCNGDLLTLTADDVEDWADETEYGHCVRKYSGSDAAGCLHAFGELYFKGCAEGPGRLFQKG